jgi:hypothetical protein
MPACVPGSHLASVACFARCMLKGCILSCAPSTSCLCPHTLPTADRPASLHFCSVGRGACGLVGRGRLAPQHERVRRASRSMGPGGAPRAATTLGGRYDVVGRHAYDSWRKRYAVGTSSLALALAGLIIDWGWRREGVHTRPAHIPHPRTAPWRYGGACSRHWPFTTDEWPLQSPPKFDANYERRHSDTVNSSVGASCSGMPVSDPPGCVDRLRCIRRYRTVRRRRASPWCDWGLRPGALRCSA